jgi:hypothetical protein
MNFEHSVQNSDLGKYSGFPRRFSPRNDGAEKWVLDPFSIVAKYF